MKHLISKVIVTGTLVLVTLSGYAEERVLVIGAGMAGLTAARDLSNAGLNVTLLEARNRLGGRTYTDTNNATGIPLDMGASWILGIADSVIYDTAVEAGVLVSEHTDWTLYQSYDFDGTPNVITAKEDANFLKLITMECHWHANRGTNKSMESMLESMYINGDFDKIVDNRREFDYLSNTYLELEYAGDVSLMSAQQCWEGEDYTGDDVILPGGYIQIVDHLAQGLDIRLGHVVTDIAYGSNGVTVAANGTNFSADRAVITVPIGVLKAGDIHFSPELPESKKNAIAKLGSGTINKTWLQFPYAFWDTDKLMLGYVSNPKDVFTEWYSFDDLESQNVLLAFNGGSRAIAMEAMTDEEITAEAMDVLRAMYGPNIPNPINVIQTRWNSDPFAKGAYGFMMAGADVETTRYKLRKPVSNRLFFAGEATSVDYYATTTGAMLTGAQAAQEIIDLQ